MEILTPLSLAIPIKKEGEKAVCSGCLSIERRVTPLKNYVDIFVYLLGHQNGFADTSSTTILLCWECTALLNNVHKFQLRIQQAQFILQQAIYPLDDSSIPSLSTLSSKQIKNNEILLEHEENKRKEKANKHSNKTEKDCLYKIKVDLECKQENLDINYEELDFDEREDIELEVPKEEDSFSNVDIKNHSIKKEKSVLKKRTDKKPKVKNRRDSNRRQRKYGKNAKITENKDIDLKNIQKYYSKLFVGQKEIEDIVEKDRKHRRINKLRYKCRKCNISFRMTVDLKRHNTFTHLTENEAPYRCQECKTIISTWIELQSHWDVHNYVLQCNLCGVQCRRENEIARHVETHSNVFGCTECGASFHCLRDFTRHYRDLHKHVVCDHCGMQFMHKYAIEKHMRRHHLTAKCQKCQNTYRNSAILCKHYRLCHPEVIYKAVNTELSYCVECDKQFPSVYKYKRHLATAPIHRPQKKVSIPCPECDKSFSRKIYMTNHYKVVHLGTTNHHCGLCNKYFSTAYSMKNHRKYVHDKLPMPKNKICDICGRGFSTNRILTNHRRTHTGERPHRCAHCPAAFVQRVALVAHARSQHRHDASSDGTQ